GGTGRRVAGDDRVGQRGRAGVAVGVHVRDAASRIGRIAADRAGRHHPRAVVDQAAARVRRRIAGDRAVGQARRARADVHAATRTGGRVAGDRAAGQVGRAGTVEAAPVDGQVAAEGTVRQVGRARSGEVAVVEAPAQEGGIAGDRAVGQIGRAGARVL